MRNDLSEQKDYSIRTLNKLLRGEISAVETYDKAIAKFENHPARSTLLELRNQHDASAEQIRRHIAEMDGEPQHESGAWGTFVNAVQSAANLLGKDSAIQSLEAGEETGKRDYESSLEDEELTPDSKEMIRIDLLPRVLRNIELLQGLDTRDS